MFGGIIPALALNVLSGIFGDDKTTQQTPIFTQPTAQPLAAALPPTTPEPLTTSEILMRSGYFQGANITGTPRGFAEGGEVRAPSPTDEDLVQAAMEAVSGGGENPQAVIDQFVQEFGPDALADLMSRSRGSPPMPSGGDGLSVGDGLSDSIPAQIGGSPTSLSDGEFVMPADVVSGIGNGSTQAGVRKLLDMIEKVRMARNGSAAQPNRINPQEMMNNA